MILVYCFIGQLPSYVVETIHQARLFFDGPVYLITSDLGSRYVPIVQAHRAIVIPYETVKSEVFHATSATHFHKFHIVAGLHGREKLFIYSFERFFSLYHLMEQRGLSDVLFVELDNVLYDDPVKWESAFREKSIAFMLDNDDRCASGICYVRDAESLGVLNRSFLDFIAHSNKFINEMSALHEFWERQPDKVQILPTFWPSPEYPVAHHAGYATYRSIFDAAAIGAYLCGFDPIHTNGVVVKGLRWSFSRIDYTRYRYKWERDERGRNVPYVHNGDEWIRINNLHVCSKQLDETLSQPLDEASTQSHPCNG